jgi:hypothetical protein
MLAHVTTIVYSNGISKQFESKIDLSTFLNCPICQTNPNFWYIIYKQHSEIEKIY